MLKMTHLAKAYRTEVVETFALRDFSIHVREGEFVAVTGPSGSGKTTFLTIAGLLEEFSGGEYQLDGANVRGLNDNQRSRLRNEKIGFIFQAFNLIADLNVQDNIDVPLRYRGFDAAGNPIDRSVKDFHARVVQHEVDHLDGILYPRRIRDLTQFGFNDALFPGEVLQDE